MYTTLPCLQWGEWNWRLKMLGGGSSPRHAGSLGDLLFKKLREHPGK